MQKINFWDLSAQKLHVEHFTISMIAEYTLTDFLSVSGEWKYKTNIGLHVLGKGRIRLYFFIAAQMVQVAQPLLFEYTQQLGQSGQQ